MRYRQYLILLLVMLCTHSYTLAQQTPLPTPPNGIWLQDNLFIDQTEISNLHWLEYLYYLQQESSVAIYEAALPDTSVWSAIDSSGHFQEHYFQDPAYRHMAVVGVSYQQAKAYCQWRTAAVNANIQEKARQNNQPPSHKVLFRLPTIKEWEMAAAGELNPEEYPYGQKEHLQKPVFKQSLKSLYARTESELSYKEFKKLIRKFKRKGRVPEFNCVKSINETLTYSNLMPEAVHKLSENTLSLKGMIGNVAEMTSSRGIAKGGSFLHRCEDCTIQKYQEYLKPAPWLGFRCVAEVELLQEGE